MFSKSFAIYSHVYIYIYICIQTTVVTRKLLVRLAIKMVLHTIFVGLGVVIVIRREKRF